LIRWTDPYADEEAAGAANSADGARLGDRHLQEHAVFVLTIFSCKILILSKMEFNECARIRVH
jgi:hypothetical protein